VALWNSAATLELCDRAEGPGCRGAGAPVCVVGVLATLQDVLGSVVVGLLVEHPGAVRHHTGVELPELKGLINRRAVLNTLCCLTSKTLLVIELDLPGLSRHLERIELKMVKLCRHLVFKSFDLFLLTL